jgi:hypothetical protein
MELLFPEFARLFLAGWGQAGERVLEAKLKVLCNCVVCM